MGSQPAGLAPGRRNVFCACKRSRSALAHVGTDKAQTKDNPKIGFTPHTGSGLESGQPPGLASIRRIVTCTTVLNSVPKHHAVHDLASGVIFRELQTHGHGAPIKGAARATKQASPTPTSALHAIKLQ